jgi:hypothetical protein
MTDITPKSRLEGKRGHVVHTRPWQTIADFYRDLVARGVPVEPLLSLVEAIGSSAVASQLFGATSMSDLLVSDAQDFRRGDGTLWISYRASEHEFAFRHITFSGGNDQKTCAEAEALQTLRLFVRMKYGVLLETPTV